MAEQGIGARVLRKEDARHLHGRGNFVTDMILPGQQEVAFLRSPVAHGRVKRIGKPQGCEEAVFVWGDLAGVKPITSTSTLPGYQLSSQHPLAHEKVRFVGDPVAMAVAPSRAEAEDLLELVELEIEDLPALVDALVVRDETSTRVHEEWPNNLFITMNYESGFDAKAQGAPVVVEREASLSRQAMVPMEGKAVLAYWDERADQLMVYTSTQTPHMIRIGLAETLGIHEGQIRVISPDVGGGFGYKCILQPEEICVCWLALKFRRPFRYIEDRREHLTAGANARQHAYKLRAYADNTGRLLALDAEITIDGGAYSMWPYTVGLETGQATGNLPGPYEFRGYRCKTQCVATNKPGFLPYRGVARTGVCFAMELLMDALARKVGREPWEVRRDNLVPAAAMPYDNVAKKHYDSGDYQKALLTAKEKIGFEAVRARQQRGEPDGRLIGLGFASYCEQSAHGTSVFAAWGLSLVPGYDQATVRVTPGGGLEIRVGVHSHGQGMETTLAQVAHEVLGVDLGKIHVVLGDTGLTPYSTGT
ncbi:MAG TPA: xanthine dehydrogenase family protein, partial [Stellaceae bacterium]|nr:xanthine dehydrogenase family protein [Stellaceae bacterium]